MKAIPSLLAVLLLLSSTSFAQTASPPPAESSPSTEAGAVAAVPFAPGAKIFIEPMEGFGQLVAEEIVKKKTPVVVVDEREKADFIMSGEARVKKPGFFSGWVITTHGQANVSLKDARTGNVVFAHKFTRVDTMVTEHQIYVTWAGECAKHLKKALKDTEKDKR